MNSEIELEITIRLFDLSEEALDKLRNKFPESNTGRHFKTQKPIRLIELNINNIETISSFMPELHINPKQSDIFISFTTEYDSRIINIPQFVVDASFRLGSKLTLSYTVV